MSHSNSHVTAPNVHNWRAAAVVASVHALIILLLKIGVQRYDPVGTFLVRTALIRPESWQARVGLRVHRVGVVGPTFDGELSRSGIRILDLEKCHSREVVIYGDRDFLCERSCLSFEDELLTRSENIFCALVFLLSQEKC